MSMFTALSLFSELGEDDIQWIFETAHEEPVLSHALITQEGQWPEALYVMLQGLAEVVVDSSAPRRVATLGPGELIGEMSLLENLPASATVRALENSLLLAIPREALAAKLRAEPPFAARWYRAFALILAVRLRTRVADLTQQLRVRESQEDTVSGAWKPLHDAMDALKSNLDAADRESHGQQSIPAARADQIVEEFLHFCELLNRSLDPESGLDPHLREELAGRVRLEFVPYVRLTTVAQRCYDKPRGYAGDFQSIEMIYRNQPEGIGELGALVDRCFLEMPAAEAVRNRRGLLADEIRRTWHTAGDRVTQITSLGCGPADELFDVLAAPPAGGVLRSTLIDIDSEALALVEQKARQRGVSDLLSLVQGNLLYLATGRHRLDVPPQDLVYSIGLIDYLSDAFTIKLIDFAHGLLRPGGRLILGNFHPDNPSKAILDSVLEWRLIHRTEEDMHRLFKASKFGRPCTNIRFEGQGINLFAECVKE